VQEYLISFDKELVKDIQEETLINMYTMMARIRKFEERVGASD